MRCFDDYAVQQWKLSDGKFCLETRCIGVDWSTFEWSGTEYIAMERSGPEYIVLEWSGMEYIALDVITFEPTGITTNGVHCIGRYYF
jgi:hypothetical protein